MRRCIVCGKLTDDRWGGCSEECQRKSGPLLSLDRVGVPRRYFSARLGDFTEAETKGVEEGLSSGEGIFLTGGTGIGKTHLAAALVYEHRRQYIGPGKEGILWRRCPDLLMEIRSAYRKGAEETETEIVRRFRDIGLLVIDDLGAEKMTDWSLSSLYAIIAGRVDDIRPTIITSNMTLRDLDGWEPRIASRLSCFVGAKLKKTDRRVSR